MAGGIPMVELLAEAWRDNGADEEEGGGHDVSSFSVFAETRFE
jgi:hypothetical protein